MLQIHRVQPFKLTRTLLSLGSIIAVVLFGWTLRPVQAQARAVITVNTTDDVIANDGQCSLREAITAANENSASGGKAGECAAGSGQDTINVPAGVYRLTRTGTGDNDNLTGDLDINANMTIVGDSAETTIISGGQEDRVFHNFANAELTNLTIRNGNTAFGGGIGNNGTLTVNNSTISGNTATNQGGGIRNNGTLTVNNSTISGNSATDQGGGIRNNGTLTVNNSTISDNTVTDFGGGIYNVDGSMLTVIESTISGNSASNSGGGIFNAINSTLTVSNTTFSDNSAANRGGGIRNNGTLTVNNSTISGNSADEGGGLSNSETLTINRSTFKGNSAQTFGGAIASSGLNVTAMLNNVTLSDNSATSGGGAIYNEQMLTLNNSTISGNSALSGGGIYVAGGYATLHLQIRQEAIVARHMARLRLTVAI